MGPCEKCGIDAIEIAKDITTQDFIEVTQLRELAKEAIPLLDHHFTCTIPDVNRVFKKGKPECKACLFLEKWKDTI